MAYRPILATLCRNMKQIFNVKTPDWPFGSENVVYGSESYRFKGGNNEDVAEWIAPRLWELVFGLQCFVVCTACSRHWWSCNDH